MTISSARLAPHSTHCARLRSSTAKALSLALLAVAAFSHAAVAQGPCAGQTFTNRAAFESMSAPGGLLVESFNGFSNGSAVSQLFGGLIPFTTPKPTVFWGSWGSGYFSGGGLIPEPRFQSKPAVLSFSTPVFGVGANTFDDFDGSPGAAIITLTATTTSGCQLIVSESVASWGNTGFLGAVSSEGIVSARFAISGTGGNLELDGLVVIPEAPCPQPVAYCSAKLNSQGCVPSMSWSGVPSAGQPANFVISASSVLNQKPGMLFYGFAPAAMPFQGGTLCVAGAIRRMPITSSGGASGATDCSGVLSVDFNARIQSGIDPHLAPGATVYCQYWYRDPQSAFATGLSDALRVVVCP